MLEKGFPMSGGPFVKGFDLALQSFLCTSATVSQWGICG